MDNRCVRYYDRFCDRINRLNIKRVIRDVMEKVYRMSCK